LLPALAIDALNNSAEVYYNPDIALLALPMVISVLLCAVPALIGLAFGYFIARRGSNIARWLLVLLLCLGVTTLVVNSPGRSHLRTIWIVTILTELLKIGAVICLFLPDANRWFARESGAA
jgi:uncharacterized membrane protein